MSKKRVFFILSSLRAGGAERVFWLISQYFDKSKYDVSLVILNSNNAFFSLNVKELDIIQLNTIKASKSFFKLYALIKKAKPDVVFTTGGHVNLLIALISLFAKVPLFIARETNLFETRRQFGGFKQKFWTRFTSLAYKKIDLSICQSQEIKDSLIRNNHSDPGRLVIIPNPVLETKILKSENTSGKRKLIVVARLTEQKGHSRLLDIFKDLPDDYHLSIAGDGNLKESISNKIAMLGLSDRVTMLGQVPNIVEVIAQHDLMVLPSFTEGFPNVVIEALSVGVPVVSFEVSGIESIITNGFNGYIVPQNDLTTYKKCILKCFEKAWDSDELRNDVNSRFGIGAVVKMYETLVA
ncbi:MAG: glycosyl transferase group 1 [Sphingobacteriales bacterium]|nr:glycosyl transferase group 1 [Sphingobacteriales bacterium]